MSRFDTREFGDAAPFLRKSELELLTAQTIAFDGRPNNHTEPDITTSEPIFIGLKAV